MKKLVPILIIVAVAAVFVYLVTRPGGERSPDASGKMKVTASFYPTYFLAKEIGADKVDVVNLTPAGAEPHDYELSARDIARIEASRVLILNGIVEPWSGDVQKNTDLSRTTMVVAGEGLFAPAPSDNETDPHIWLDPKLMRGMAENILAGLKKADPDNAAYYDTNAFALAGKLAELDAEFGDGLNTCSKKDFITAHDAFAYLASEYGLTQTSIAGLSPDSEPSPSELAKIVSFAKENAVKYIFFESLVSPKLAKTIANEVGAETLVLNPLEGLTDEEIHSGEDYFSVMRANLANLKTALGCAK